MFVPEAVATTAVTGEAVATANGTLTIFKLAQFPVVRPKKVYDLQGRDGTTPASAYSRAVITSVGLKFSW